VIAWAELTWLATLGAGLMSKKTITVYSDVAHKPEEVLAEIKEAISSSLETSLSSAKEVFNEDEIAKYRVQIIVDVDH